ncbi:MAG TPA: response regulator transcription factor, partial [Candidatus Obscuribacterales bacterium]
MVEKAHGKTVKTLIVQEEEIVSLGLRCAVEQMPEAVLVGEVRDGRTAVATAIEQRVQLVLIDIVLRELDGIQATKLIKEAIPAKIIIVTAQQNATDVIAGFVAGADAYCMRDV